MARTRGERRHLTEKVKDKAKKRADMIGQPWWKVMELDNKPGDSVLVNNRWLILSWIGPNKIGRNYQHNRMERSTERRFVMKEEAA